MATPAPIEPVAPPRMTVERYFALVDEGLLDPGDRVELLEGMVVAMSPSNPPHATVASLVYRTLSRAIGERAAVRCQLSIILGRYSAPEPDIAVVAGCDRDYMTAHPKNALLLVEVADTSIAQDRLTKGSLYAAAGVPEYWIVNLRTDCIEVRRDPEPAAGRYRERTVVSHGERIALVALPDVHVVADDFLPGALGG